MLEKSENQNIQITSFSHHFQLSDRSWQTVTNQALALSNAAS